MSVVSTLGQVYFRKGSIFRGTKELAEGVFALAAVLVWVPAFIFAEARLLSVCGVTAVRRLVTPYYKKEGIFDKVFLLLFFASVVF